MRVLTIIHGLEIVYERENILMTHRNLLQHSNLISNLVQTNKRKSIRRSPGREKTVRDGWPYHVLSSNHEPLVNNLRSIIPPCVDVDALFHDTVAPRAESFTSLVTTRLDLWFRGGR